MKSTGLEISLLGKKTTCKFKNEVAEINDKDLIKLLIKPSLNNDEPLFLINSLKNVNSYDLSNIKINIKNSISLLVRFNPNKITTEIKDKIIEEISELKVLEATDESTAKFKFIKVVKFLIQHEPLFATVTQRGEIKMDADLITNLLSDVDLNFPLLVLKRKQSIVNKANSTINNFINRIWERNIATKKESKTQSKLNINFFTFDLLFSCIFTILISFSVVAGIYKAFNKDNTGIFLFVLSLIYLGVLSFIWNTAFSNKKITNKKVNCIVMIIYMLIGTTIGIISSILISKSFFIIKVDDFDLNKVIKLCIPLSLLWVYVSIPIGLIISLIKNK